MKCAKHVSLLHPMQKNNFRLSLKKINKKMFGSTALAGYNEVR